MEIWSVVVVALALISVCWVLLPMHRQISMLEQKEKTLVMLIDGAYEEIRTLRERVDGHGGDLREIKGLCNNLDATQMHLRNRTATLERRADETDRDARRFNANIEGARRELEEHVNAEHGLLATIEQFTEARRTVHVIPAEGGARTYESSHLTVGGEPVIFLNERQTEEEEA